jgi:hypothetical protein
MKTKTAKPSKIWRTADGRRIPIKELGDKHLVAILRLIEQNLHIFGAGSFALRLDGARIRQYSLLVDEAITRGLISWSENRKQLDKIEDLAAEAK